MKLTNFLLVAATLWISACSGKSADSNAAESIAADTVATKTVEANQAEETAATANADYAIKVFGAGDKLVPGNKPVVVDFSATWCGPCQRFKPIFHNVAALYADKAEFATADVDECNELAAAYNVQSIPFVLILNPDGSKASNTGLMSEAEFKAFLDKNLKPAK